MSQSIEDIILQQDKRGVAELRPHLPADFCRQAASYVLDHPGHTAIVTGYYITMSGGPETDGPAGAIAIGRALQNLGRRVTYVTDSFTGPAMRELAGDGAEVVEFPIADVETSRAQAAELLQRLQPDLLLSIERSGRTRDETYLNMRDVDITPNTARVDYLFESDIPSVAIGDGGNEIGMGNLAEVIPSVERLPNNPSMVHGGQADYRQRLQLGRLRAGGGIVPVDGQGPAALGGTRDRDAGPDGGPGHSGRHHRRGRPRGGRLHRRRKRSGIGTAAPGGGVNACHSKPPGANNILGLRTDNHLLSVVKGDGKSADGFQTDQRFIAQSDNSDREPPQITYLENGPICGSENRRAGYRLPEFIAVGRPNILQNRRRYCKAAIETCVDKGFSVIRHLAHLYGKRQIGKSGINHRLSAPPSAYDFISHLEYEAARAKLRQRLVQSLQSAQP